jgi:hypothetical protein
MQSARIYLIAPFQASSTRQAVISLSLHVANNLVGSFRATAPYSILLLCENMHREMCDIFRVIRHPSSRTTTEHTRVVGLRALLGRKNESKLRDESAPAYFISADISNFSLVVDVARK